MVRRIHWLVLAAVLTWGSIAEAKDTPTVQALSASAGPVFVDVGSDSPGGSLGLGWDVAWRDTSPSQPSFTECFIGTRLTARNTTVLSVGTLSLVGGGAFRFDRFFLSVFFGLGLAAEEDRRGTGFVLGLSPSSSFQIGLMLDEHGTFFGELQLGTVFARFQDADAQSYLLPTLGYRGSW